MSDNHWNAVRNGDGLEFEAQDKVGIEITDPGPGKHLWTVMAVYQIIDPAAALEDGAIHMDQENLVSVVGPGCYKCEKSWSADTARRFCKGAMI